MNSVSWASGSPNYNLYSLDGFSSSTPFYANGSYTFANYQSHVGGAGEANSTNPATSNVNYTTGKLILGSGAIGAGTNLYSTCNGQPNPGLGALCFDAAGVARPSSAAWDIGAYQYVPATNGPEGLLPGTSLLRGSSVIIQ